MASLVSNLSPVPSFPEYTGPYKVGTIDVEIPVSGLASPSPTPEGASGIDTVLFRVFYPAAAPGSQGKRVSWLPAPQRLHIAAYAQFLGAGSTLASILSFLPRHLHWTSIPAYKNAALLSPPPDQSRSRWPTMIFSHGLGGNRNAYSHLAGSLASYGAVVICPEHRDGSAALTLIRDPKAQDRKGTRHMVPYLRIAHTQTHEVWEARNKQLRIRLWELGLVFDVLCALDAGNQQMVQSNLNQSTPQHSLAQFAHALDIEPGRVIFSGHSFGAATIVQLLKSTFYANHPSLAPNLFPNPLFTPSPTSSIAAQITPSTPTILLDMWCFPLLSASTAPLYNLPLPSYSCSPAGPGGSALLAIESQAFVNWTEHLHAKARILSPDPTARAVTSDMFNDSHTDTETDTDTDTEDPKKAGKGMGVKKPRFFYVTSSAHLNQSDFGILFPRLTRRVFKSDTPPERVLRLNVRAALQFLRENNITVAGTARGDLVEDLNHHRPQNKGGDEWITQDEIILRQGDGSEVEAWRWIDVVGLGGKAGPSEIEMERGERGVEEEVKAEVGEREMQGEMEPSLEREADGGAAVHAAEVVGGEGK